MNQPPLITHHPAEYFAALVREALDETLGLATRAQAARALDQNLWPCLVDVQVAHDRERDRRRIAARAAAAARAHRNGEAEVVSLFRGRW